MKQIIFLTMTILILLENVGIGNISTEAKSVIPANEKDVHVETLQIKGLHKNVNENISGVIAWDSG